MENSGILDASSRSFSLQFFLVEIKFLIKLFPIVGLLVFFCLYASKSGGEALMNTIDSIQEG